MKSKSLVILLTVLVLSGCKKDLDLTSNEYFGIKTFLKSENAKTKCGKKAKCEGKTIKLKGILDADNINKETSEFRLIDEKKDKYSIMVSVDTLIKTVVFDKLEGKGGLVFKVEGIVEGFDKNTNFSCDRGFIIKLDDDSKVFQ